MPIIENIDLNPIGYVSTEAIGKEIKNKKIISNIILKEDLIESLEGISDFSHLFIIFWMHKITKEQRKISKVHPRGRKDMPFIGIFSTRTPYRPNPIGLTLVEILEVKRNIIKVRGLDAFSETPILDIKPFDHWDTKCNIKVPEWWTRLKKTKRT